MAAILFFKMRPKIFPGNILWLWIYPANLRRLAIIFFLVRAVTVKSLYSLRQQFFNQVNKYTPFILINFNQICFSLLIGQFHATEKSPVEKIHTKKIFYTCGEKPFLDCYKVQKCTVSKLCIIFIISKLIIFWVFYRTQGHRTVLGHFFVSHYHKIASDFHDIVSCSLKIVSCSNKIVCRSHKIVNQQVITTRYQLIPWVSNSLPQDMKSYPRVTK